MSTQAIPPEIYAHIIYHVDGEVLVSLLFASRVLAREAERGLYDTIEFTSRLWTEHRTRSLFRQLSQN